MSSVSTFLTLFAATLSGIATAIPVIVKLINTIQDLVKERNWNKMVDEMLGFMQTAKEMFDANQGAEKKAWVMQMVQESAKKMKYDIDMDAISQLIDAVCDTSKVLRAKQTES